MSPAPSAEPSPPSSIGSYRVVGHLGRGGMAQVYRAEHQTLKRVVALKVVLPDFADDPAFRERFLSEAQASASLAHPNVIICYDAGEVDGHLFMALELVEGGDLMGLLERRGGRLDEGQVLTFAHDCLAGIGAIAAAGLVHRDIKPANIFITANGQAKIADLGLARQVRVDASALAGKEACIMGTPCYMSPEQIHCLPDLDVRTDLYALGASLVHLLTGAPLYAGADPLSTLAMTLSAPFPDLRSRRGDLSTGVLAILQRLLARDREQRYRSAEEAREDVGRALSGTAPRHAPRHGERGGTVRIGPETTRAFSDGGPQRPISDATMRYAAAVGGIDAGRLAALAKRVIVDRHGLRAAITLAANASFPPPLIERMIEAAGIRFGVDPDGVAEATRAAAVPRRIVIARGDAPGPGVAGTSVRGEALPPLVEHFRLHVHEDAMVAVATIGVAQPVPVPDLQRALRERDLRAGLDPVALQRLVAGPLVAGERIIIARGSPAVPGTAAGFHLATTAAPAGADGEAPGATVGNYSRVAAGALLARWSPGEAGKAGIDVHGRPLPIAAPPLRSAAACAGEGTLLHADAAGDALVAVRDGVVQECADGSVRVVTAIEVPGDLGPDHAPIHATGLVLVRGDVQAGAVISSTEDVVVLGSLGDAQVTAGGDLVVGGTIAGGVTPVLAGGELRASGIGARRVLAGAVRIGGSSEHSQVAANGDIHVRRVRGGRLVAGGSIHAEIAGDADGTATELWAGQGLGPEQHQELVRVVTARHAAARERLLAESKALKTEIDDATRSGTRLEGAHFTRRDVLIERQAKLRLMTGHLDSLRRSAEQARLRGESDRAALARAPGAAAPVDPAAAIRIAQLAHDGVSVRLADRGAETLVMPQGMLVIGGE